MSDEQGAKEPHESVSRRSMLKRIGAVGAIAWVTPVISSLNTPAYAATSFVTCGHECVHCENNSDLCGQAGPIGECFCTPRADGGDCFCGEAVFCDQTNACRTDDECTTGWICANVCGCTELGSSVCIPQCGSFDRQAVGARHGATTSGRTV